MNTEFSGTAFQFKKIMDIGNINPDVGFFPSEGCKPVHCALSLVLSTYFQSQL